MRALVRHGWLRVETQSDFSQQYTLPDYAFRLLETLEVIAANEPPLTTLNHVTAHRCDGSAVVTVENSTSFSEFITAKPASMLAIYTGGFAGPAVVGMLSKIRAARPKLPFFHWGDLDVGGLRIMAHLRKNLGEVEPLAMDVAVCDLYLKRS